ncbi:MAG: polymerase subunit gamma/tau, partial [Actinomycetota bacterium]
MSTALYRRYRPESFSELIGQTQVVEPLMSALRADRVNHAYLFSGPRGCGKTTSARILARCLNCAEGPTDTPCGKCPSCVDLARGGSGSLDVVEIDAASHNGVDDARDLRERAIFAPARDRYKIFILDEAHMVTTQGFNALLKIVEEPPAHVKFIFATTEPDKVIGTIRSRTHHYPFRLVPPGELLEYLTSLLETEGYSAEGGVMPLVVRASGGSVRDALSLLDQLIAGSDSKEISYQRAVNLLGFTHDQLMSEVIDAFSEIDPAKAFSAVDKVIQSGQDARRFLEDLLERIRDLMLVSSLGDGARAILRGLGPEQFDLLTIQANRFGLNQLTATAEATARALSDTSAASNPRLQLELLCARVLAPAIEAPVIRKAQPAVANVTSEAAAPAAKPTQTPAASVAAPAPVQKPVAAAAEASTSGFKNGWGEILDALAKKSRSAWAVAFTTKVLDYQDEVLT